MNPTTFLLRLFPKSPFVKSPDQTYLTALGFICHFSFDWLWYIGIILTQSDFVSCIFYYVQLSSTFVQNNFQNILIISGLKWFNTCHLPNWAYVYSLCSQWITWWNKSWNTPIKLSFEYVVWGFRVERKTAQMR